MELFNRCLVDITLKSRKMINHRLLFIIKMLIDFFYVKTWEARRTITACIDSVVNFSSHKVSLGFLYFILPTSFILVDIFTLLRYTFLFVLIYLSS